MSKRLVSERSRPDECIRLYGGLPEPAWAVVHYIERSRVTWEAVSSARFDTHADARRHFDAFQLGRDSAHHDPEYADIDTDGQLALGVPGDQRAIPGLAQPRQEG